MALEQLGIHSYTVSLDSGVSGDTPEYAILAIMPVFEKQGRSRREMLAGRYRTMIDLQELSPLEMEFDKELLVPYKRILSGLASEKEVRRTLVELVPPGRRADILALLVSYGLVKKAPSILHEESFITYDSKYMVKLEVLNYKSVRVSCLERNSATDKWSLDYERKVTYRPEEIEGSTIVTKGKDVLRRVLCGIIDLEPELQFSRV